MDMLTEEKGQITHYKYDPINRLFLVSYPDHSTVQNIYDSVGNITSRFESTLGIFHFVFDDLNRLRSKTDAFGNTVGFQYDPAGNLTSLTYPDHQQVSYSSFNGENQVLTAQTLNGSYQLSYDADLNQTGLSYPNRVAETYGYDRRNELLTINRTGFPAPPHFGGPH